MLGYVVRRALSLAAVLFAASAVMFVLIRVVPSDPVRAALGDGATQEQVISYREELGLDRPLPAQYAVYLAHLLRGDLGRSIYTHRLVVDDMRRFLPATVELALFSLVFSTVVGISLGVFSAITHNSLWDYLSQMSSLFLLSTPVFWLGLICQLIFFHWLGWLPVGFRLDTTMTRPPQVTGLMTVDALLAGQWTALADALRHMILPVVVLSNLTLPAVARMTRASVLDESTELYVVTARAKGLSTGRILRGHVLKNAALPVVTLLGIRFGQMLGGAIVTESIFQWPGIGRYAFDAISRFDYPALMGSFLVAVFLFGLVNLLVDLLYFWLNPRLREAG